jgi:hypothetical protein
MAGQIIPINDIASAGVVIDMPAVSLAENMFTDCLNVRFRDGAVRKMEGEEAIPTDVNNTTPNTDSIIYVAFWDNPNLDPGEGYYIVVTKNGSFEKIIAIKNKNEDGTDNPVRHVLKHSIPTGGVWQHTLFNGGFSFIINNGVEKPLYVQDVDGNQDITNLAMYDIPGWDSYYANEEVISSVFNPTSLDTTLEFDLGQLVETVGTSTDDADRLFVDKNVTVTVINGETATIRNFGTFFGVGTDSTDAAGNPNQTIFTCANPPNSSNTTTVTLSVGSVLEGDTVVIKIQSKTTVKVRCGVIRAYKNLLIAGNLTEFNSTNTKVIRRLAGVVRTSDVAAPGSMPSNWNPFSAGVSTAEEFTLSSTGTVQDMAELQGRMYIYTNNSIHSLEQTGSSVVPFSISTVTDSYGAQTIEAVQEYDGKHIVVGSGDVYIFGGHPGSIKSIAALKVRNYLINNLNKAHEQKLFILRYQFKDEIWICYPKGTSTTVNECLIWNYRLENWTIRRLQNNITSGDIAPYQNNPNERVPIFSYSTEIMYGDKSYTNVAGAAYESYVERRRLAMSPEFDTETLASIAMKIEGSGASLTVNVLGTNIPGQDANPTTGVSNTFVVNDDYKIDIRESGRFINYKLSETGTNSWSLSGLEYEILKGGTR